ncbi:MAG: hypothetical protein O9277_03050 [Magnetospirillum sp.]|nr:hypothetical protein [Magnetospirillum sp.]
MAKGYTAIRIQCGVPGLPDVYGTGKLSITPHGAADSLPQTEIWSTDKYAAHLPRVFEAVRGKFGAEVSLLHDVHHRLTPMEAARLCRSVEPYRPFWMEDPTPSELQEGFRTIRRNTVVPLATGEINESIWGVKTLLEEQLVDYVRCTPAHAGGITHVKRIVDLAALHQIRSGFHGAADLSPVAIVACLHLGMAINNFGIQEYMGHPPEIGEVFRVSYRQRAGRMHPGDAPGLGVEFDASAAARFPYVRAYLPVARLEDGTLWHY